MNERPDGLACFASVSAFFEASAASIFLKENPTTSENVCTEMAFLTATQNTSTKQKPMISKDPQENYIPASDFGNANLMLPPGRTRK